MKCTYAAINVSEMCPQREMFVVYLQVFFREVIQNVRLQLLLCSQSNQTNSTDALKSTYNPQRALSFEAANAWVLHIAGALDPQFVIREIASVTHVRKFPKRSPFLAVFSFWREQPEVLRCLASKKAQDVYTGGTSGENIHCFEMQLSGFVLFSFWCKLPELSVNECGVSRSTYPAAKTLPHQLISSAQQSMQGRLPLLK